MITAKVRAPPDPATVPATLAELHQVAAELRLERARLAAAVGLIVRYASHVPPVVREQLADELERLAA